MGYTTIPLTGGAMDIKGAQFINVGTEALDIQSIVLNNAQANDWLQLYDASSTSYRNAYNWKKHSYNWDDEDEKNDLGPGWADGDAVRYSDYNDNAVKIDPGQSFWIFMAAETGVEKSFTVSGQVLAPKTGYETIDMIAGKMDLICTPFPCAADIQNVQLVNAQANDWLQLYDSSKTAYKNAYNWKMHSYNWDDEDEKNDLGPGWADGDAVRYSEYNDNAVTIGVGQGFWLFMAGDGKGNTPQVRFVSPIPAAE